MIEVIDSPFNTIRTVRFKDSPTFRPAATGQNLEELEIRARMEDYEVRYLAELGIVALGSAAHPDEKQSIINAKKEAVERVSLAAWWALRRGGVAKIDFGDLSKGFEKEQSLPPGFSVAIGFVESVEQGLWVAATILMNQHESPYAVLGGGCAEDPKQAAAKSFFESVQSWTGTQWTNQNLPAGQAAYWDIAELRLRAEDVGVSDDLTDSCAANDAPSFFEEMVITNCASGKAHITAVEAPGLRSLKSSDLATLAMRAEERVAVFTEHNY